MKIVIAPNPFKNCLDGMTVCLMIEKGFKRVWPDAEYIKIPMADGGDGTLDALVAVTQGRIIDVPVKDPLQNNIKGRLGLLGDEDTAIVEMAEASGLRLLPRTQLNPLVATSYGTGQLIKAALDNRVKKIIVGIGGSATVDGGIGMMQALGVEFLDASGSIIVPYASGKDLTEISTIDMSHLDPRVMKTEFLVASDVTNPLCGPHGAAAVFGPQKGATPDMIAILDQGLLHLSKVILQTLNRNVLTVPGSGAAGGMGAALIGFLDAKLRSGIDLIMETIKFENMVRDATLVVTAEGTVDSQTLDGKAPAGVASIAAKYNVPVLIIGRGLTDDASSLYSTGCALISATPRPMTLDEAISGVTIYLPNAAECAARLIKLGIQTGA